MPTWVRWYRMARKEGVVVACHNCRKDLRVSTSSPLSILHWTDQPD